MADFSSKDASVRVTVRCGGDSRRIGCKSALVLAADGKTLDLYGFGALEESPAFAYLLAQQLADGLMRTYAGEFGKDPEETARAVLVGCMSGLAEGNDAVSDRSAAEAVAAELLGGEE